MSSANAPMAIFSCWILQPVGVVKQAECTIFVNLPLHDIRVLHQIYLALGGHGDILAFNIGVQPISDRIISMRNGIFIRRLSVVWPREGA